MEQGGYWITADIYLKNKQPSDRLDDIDKPLKTKHKV
jgi:hypothetical protein